MISHPRHGKGLGNRGGLSTFPDSNERRTQPWTWPFSNPCTKARPIASLYINTSRDTETAESKIWIRWEQARRELAAQGMDDETLGAMDEGVGDTEGVSGVRPVVYAAGGEVLFDSTVSNRHRTTWPGADPAGPTAVHGGRGPTHTHVLAVVDSIGADLRAEYADGRTVNRRVEGADKPVHKVREVVTTGHMQRAVDEQVRQNVDQVADEVTALADRSRAEVVALGEAQVRELMERLPERVRERVVVLEAGSRAPGSDSSPLDEELSALLDREAAEHRAGRVRLRARTVGGAVTDGFANTVRALQRGRWTHCGPTPSRVPIVTCGSARPVNRSS